MPNGLVGQGVEADVLGTEGAAPEEESGAGDAVVDELGGGDQVDEPGEDGGGAVGDLQEGEEGNGEDGEDGVDWDSVAGCSVGVLAGVFLRWLWLRHLPGQDLGRFAF